MEIMLPDSAEIQITIGRSLPLALTHEPARESPTRGRAHPLLKGALALALLFAGFGAGRYWAAPSESSRPTQAALVLPRVTGEQHAFPDRPLPNEPAPSRAGIDQATPQGAVPPTLGPAPLSELARQLQQPPTIVPPSGQPTGKNPFGLEN